MKILILGSGGREHALCKALQKHDVYCYPGNGGINQETLPIPDQQTFGSITNRESMGKLAQALNVDLTVVGPEAPLAAGIKDHFNSLGLPLFGPTKEGCRLEASKAFAKDFMDKHEIPTAKFQACRGPEEALKAAQSFCSDGQGVVIKADGLAAGKGVVVCHDLDEATRAIRQMSTSFSTLVVEEKLEGPEISVLVLTDGTSAACLLPSQDFKRLEEGGKGPNTGGMGAYCPTPFATHAVMREVSEQVIYPTLAGLKQDNVNYSGVVYFGLMLTESGPKLLEYNCRFGDPETQSVLPLLKSDLAEHMLACVEERLQDERLEWYSGACCCVVMAAQGYPANPRKGDLIGGTEDVPELIHAGTKRLETGEFVTAGGRVLGVIGTGDTLDEAQDEAYRRVEMIRWAGVQYRKDIGSAAIAPSPKV